MDPIWSLYTHMVPLTSCIILELVIIQIIFKIEFYFENYRLEFSLCDMGSFF